MPVCFGKYQILEKLGEGGMGIVFKAYDTQLQRTVALKILKNISGNSYKRFLREARATAGLHHPNIVKLYEVGEYEGKTFFTMEYIEGIVLEKADAVHWAVPRILELMIEICDAIAYSHEQGVIHRDLKTANIMLTPKGLPKIMDFGLAKSTKEQSKLSQTGMVLGTIMYMSPEQAEGTIREIDCRSDVYSLGCILYELLVGHPPFLASTLEEIVYKILFEKVAPPSQKKTTLKEYPLDEVCLKALEKKQSFRYQNVKSLQDDLKKILQKQPLARSKRDWMRKGYHFYKSCQSILFVFATVCLMIIGYIVFFQEKPLPVLVHRENISQNALCYSFIEDSISIQNTSPFTIDFLSISLDFPEDCKIYQSEIPQKPFSIPGKEKKVFGLSWIASSSGRQKNTVHVFHKKRLVYSKTKETLVLPAQYGLPQEISQNCLILLGENSILDMSSHFWQNLSVDLQQKYARKYQEGYAIQKGYDLEKTLYFKEVAWEFILIPPGKFLMGISQGTAKRMLQYHDPKFPFSAALWLGRLMPQHPVTISQPFYMAKGEITQKQWEVFMTVAQSRINPDFPVYGISYIEAEKFCHKSGFSLPSEAQWEYACRAGSTRMFYWGDDWGSSRREKSRCNTASYWLEREYWDQTSEYNNNNFDIEFHRLGATTLTMKHFPPNAFGLYNMQIGRASCRERV